MVSGGGLPYLHCQCALTMGGVLLHFHSLLSISTFLVFAAVVSLLISGVLVSPTLPSVGLGFLRWTVTLHLLPTFVDGRGGPGVLGFLRYCSSQFLSGSFSLASPFVPGGWGGGGGGDFVTCSCLIFSLYIILCNSFCFLPSILYRIAAAWLLHERASAGWEPMVSAVWSSHPLQTQFI